MGRIDRVDVDRSLAILDLEADGLSVVEWTDSPGVRYPPHSHPSREVRLVLEGTMTVTASGRQFELGPGDRIALDPDEEHAAVVGPEGVRYLAGTDRAHGGLRTWGAGRR